MTACNNVILVDLWWNPALEVRHVVSPLPWLHIYQTVLPGSSVWTSSPHWAEEASERMEVDDRGYGGGADPGCTCCDSRLREPDTYLLIPWTAPREEARISRVRTIRRGQKQGRDVGDGRAHGFIQAELRFRGGWRRG